MPSALVFIFVLGVLMAVHEFGHYIAARWAGVRVDRFSFWGVGPRLFGKKIGDTDFCVSLFPVGAFVQMAGEGEGVKLGEPWEFSNQPLFKKFIIVFAGPFMNALLATLLFAFVAFHGEQTLVPKVSRVLKDSPAAAAGFKEGDRIQAIGGENVELWGDFTQKLQNYPGKTVAISIERDAQTLSLSVTPEARPTHAPGHSGVAAFLGVSPTVEFLPVKTTVFGALSSGFHKTASMTTMTFVSLGQMMTGALPIKDSMTGPIGIFFMTKQAAQMGWLMLLHFMATLSVSLWVLNLLPIPVLDGGHILFILIEKIKGSPLSDKSREMATQVGMFLLLGLMVFVLAQDMDRFSIFQKMFGLFKKGTP